MKSTLRRLRACCALTLVMSSAALAQDFQAEFDSQWGLGMIGVDKAIEKGLDGAGVKVGVADTGLQIGANLHSEFEGRFLGLGSDGFGLGLDDTNGHGTHVAGTIAANRDGKGMVGVASGSEIVAMRVLLDGAPEEDQQIAAETAFRYALDQGVRIFNASYVVPGPFSDATTDVIEAAMLRELNVYREVVNAGGVMVVSAGNYEWKEPSIPAAMPMFYPELTRGWMAVVAVGPTAELAWYSQTCGGGTKHFCIAAPGGDDRFGAEGMINSTWLGGAYQGEMGTSMAAPHVSGALAIAKQLYPNASYQDLAKLVFQTATDIGEAGLDDTYGWGLLNVGNIVDTQSAQAGALYAQSMWSHAMTMNGVADMIESRHLKAEPGSRGIWLTPFGSRADLSLGNSALSGRYAANGLIGGIDFALDDRWTLGAAVGFSRDRFTADNGNAAEDVSYHAAPYISFDNDAIFADATLGVSSFSGTTQRFSAPGMAGTILGISGLGLSGDHRDRALWASARLGGHFEVSGFKASPFVFGRLARHDLDGMNETGSSILALSADAATATMGELGAGVKVSATAMAWNGLAVTPSLSLAYGRSFGDFDRTLTLLGSQIKSEIQPGKNQAELEADLLLTRPESVFETKLSYRAALSDNAVGHTVAANLKLKF